MDFDLNEDQLSLREGARELLDGVSAPDAVRVVVEAGGGRSDDIWNAMVDQGWLGVGLAEERGGLGFGTVELAVLLEEIGRHATPVPFAPTVLAIAALDGAGDAETVERLVSGVAVGTVAWSAGRDAVVAAGAGGRAARWPGARAGPRSARPRRVGVGRCPDGPIQRCRRRRRRWCWPPPLRPTDRRCSAWTSTRSDARRRSRPSTAPASWGGCTSTARRRRASAMRTPSTPCSTAVRCSRRRRCSVARAGCSR